MAYTSQKEAMQIANHPSLTQTGEHLDAEGNLFAPRFSLDGEHELPALRADLDNRFIISAQEDILRGAYKAVFIEPEQICDEVRGADHLYDESIKSQFGQTGAGPVYFYDRGPREHSTSCFHSHGNYTCTSALALADGELPTVFITEQDELAAAFDTQIDEINAAVELAQALEFSHKTFEKVRSGKSAIDICRELVGLHATGKRQILEIIYRIHENVYGKISGFVERMPKVGRISIFSGNVVHAANPYTHDFGDEPGELAVDHWRRKAR